MSEALPGPVSVGKTMDKRAESMVKPRRKCSTRQCKSAWDCHPTRLHERWSQTCILIYLAMATTAG